MSGRESSAHGGVKTQGRILIASLTLGSLATAGAVWWYYTRQVGALEEAAIRELTAVCDSKAGQLANWRDERLGDGQVLMASPVSGIAGRILSGQSAGSDRTYLLQILTSLQVAGMYAGGMLATLDGQAPVATAGATPDASRLRELARAAVAAQDAQLSDLSLDSHGRPLMALTIPVGQRGAIVLDIDPARFLYPYLRAWPGSSRTAETLLVRREGGDAVYLSELRYHRGAPLRFRRNLAGVKLPPDAAFDYGPLVRGMDYRGEPVLAIIRHIRDSPWFLSTKMDAAEADAPGRRLGWEMALITALIALLNVAGVAVVWRGQRARILKEREEWFHAAANDTPAYLWMAAPGVENSFINTPFARFLGTDRTSLADTWSDYIHPEDAPAARARFLESIRTQSEYTHEFRMRRHDGEYRWVVSKAVPRFSPGGVFLGFAGALLDVTGRRLAERKLREANDSLATQLAESTAKELEIRGLSARLIDAQEEERKRLARELHDDLSQQIAALSIATGSLKRQLPEEGDEARKLSDRLHGKIVQLASAVRRMSHELHPAILEYSGLAAAVRSYSEEFSALSGIQVSLDIRGSFEGVAPDAALCLFRVTQEALRNVAKHARVSTASVVLTRAGGLLQVTIADAGVGFATGRDPAKAGLGLLNIRERARLVDGEAEIRSKPGQGTIISVRVPDHAENQVGQAGPEGSPPAGQHNTSG
jgi:two-component system, NarL family, sensor histidine kinase UhpB